MAIPTLYDAERINQYTTAGLWKPPSLHQIWQEMAAKYPHKEALVDSRLRLTYAQSQLWIDRLALGLLEKGLEKDDMVVVQLPNSVELYLLRLACARAGLLCLPVLTNVRERDTGYILNYTKARVYISLWRYRYFDYWSMIKGLQPGLPELHHIFIAGKSLPEGASSLEDILLSSIEEKYPPDYLQGKGLKPFHYSLVGLTSGTTGFPKIVENPDCARLNLGESIASLLGLKDEDTIAALSPTAGGPNMLVYFSAPVMGAKVVLLEHFTARDALQLIEKERITMAGLVPAQLAMMLHEPSLKDYDLSSLKYLACMGAPLPYQMGLDAESKLCCTILQAYGVTDCGVSCMTSPSDPPELRIGTVGKPLKGNEVRIVDEQDHTLNAGQVGEIWMRGPSAMSGYFLNPEANKEVWTEDGWFRTGDLGKVDSQGYLSIAGRKKEMIIRGGQNIYPAEIENLLHTHPSIASTAVVAMPDPVMGEKACVYLELKPSRTITLEELLSFLKGKGLTPYKLPERLEIIDKMPMVAEGQKINKVALREDLRKKLQPILDGN